MPDYTLPNIVTGGSITVSGNSLADAQQKAADQTGVTLEQQQGGGTYGANTGGGVGGGGGGGGGYGPGGFDLGALAGAFNAAGTMSQKELDERKRKFDEDLAFRRQQMEQLQIPQVVINQQLAQLQQDEFNFESQMARQQSSLQQANVLGYYTPPDLSQSFVTGGPIYRPGGAAGGAGGGGGGGAAGLTRYAAGTVVRNADTGAFG